MIISDHLDMVGVQLKATWTQTKKVNGDIVQQRVTSTINSWRAGKFMPLTMRPWSINSFVLSKVWFRCGSVDLRVADISAITSSVKSWLYADLLEKPSEAVMCRPVSYGGLGVTSVRFKALAVLIRNFMETAANPKFRRSLLHSVLYRYHVLDDTSVPDPGYLPYYNQSFFETIKYVHLETPLNVTSMTTSEWTRILTEDCLTMDRAMDRKYIPCKAELCNPGNDWDLSWRLCRLGGLGSDLASFNFKLLHGLLVTKERLHHLTPATSTTCSHCKDKVTESLQHALLYCPYNNDVGQRLLTAVEHQVPDITPESLLRLELKNIPEDSELSTIFFISSILMEIWEKRFSKSRIRLYDIRATLEAKCLLLRETRFGGHTKALSDLLNQI